MQITDFISWVVPKLCLSSKSSVHIIFYIFFLFFFFFFFCLLGATPAGHTEVPRLGIKLELQLPTYATATAMWDLSHVFDLHCSSRQHQILNPLSVARDQTCILMDASQIRFPWATTRTPTFYSFTCWFHSSFSIILFLFLLKCIPWLRQVSIFKC